MFFQSSAEFQRTLFVFWPNRIFLLLLLCCVCSSPHFQTEAQSDPWMEEKCWGVKLGNHSEHYVLISLISWPIFNGIFNSTCSVLVGAILCGERIRSSPTETERERERDLRLTAASRSTHVSTFTLCICALKNSQNRNINWHSSSFSITASRHKYKQNYECAWGGD